MLDALDKFGPESELAKFPVFCISLMSRPEGHIGAVFDEGFNHAKMVIYKVEKSTVDRDIGPFLKIRLDDIHKELVGKFWPSKANLKNPPSNLGLDMSEDPPRTCNESARFPF